VKQSMWEITGRSKPATITEVMEILLENRKVGLSFLTGSLKDLEPYLAMTGMEAGAALMARHLAAGHKLVLIGDYDCDGVTSVAQMAHFLRDIGYANYAVVIPKRAEGYGVPERAVSQHPDAGLFVAMDCGTHDIPSVSAARQQGSDFLVIDHHEVSNSEVAPATVLINPKQPSYHSGFKDFSAAGLTLLFLARLRRATGAKFSVPRLGSKYLALAAIGTVADLMPLVDANRILTQSGLGCMNTKPYLPIRELVERARLSGRVLTSGHIGYNLAPRINAAGRMADASLALDLLMAEHGQEASRLAGELNQLNIRRQQQEDHILNEVRARYSEENAGRRTLIMGDSGWSHGVVGIIASRIQQELHYGPTIVFAIDNDTGMARGSARSIPGLDVYAALQSCKDLLVKWGGHKMAAGMTVARENLEEFSKRFEAIARTHPPELFVPRGRVDMELDLSLVSNELYSTLKKLEPHGVGNPLPTFAARPIKVVVQRRFGKDNRHIQLLLDGRIEGVLWRGGPCLAEKCSNGAHMDVIFQLGWDDFRNRLALTVKDVGKLNTLWS
jgi:single-stranded-DNA-specific exonuclease